jgi:hypothetical protein
MARNIHLRLTGTAEKFVRVLEAKGFTERDILAKALWLLEVAVSTERLGLVNDVGFLEHLFTLDGKTYELESLGKPILSVREQYAREQYAKAEENRPSSTGPAAEP